MHLFSATPAPFFKYIFDITKLFHNDPETVRFQEVHFVGLLLQNTKTVLCSITKDGKSRQNIKIHKTKQRPD